MACATTAPGPKPAPATSPEPSFQTVSQALTRGNANQAVKEYEAFREKDSDKDHPESLLFYANLLLGDGQLDKARAAFQAVLDKQPNSADAMFGLYLVALNQGDPRTAKRLLDNALAANPAHAGALCAKGQIELALKNYAKAMDCFDRSLAQDSGNLVAQQGKAAVLARTDHLPEAVNLLCDILAKQPDNLAVRGDRARLYAELERWDAALADMDQLVIAEPDNYFNFLDRGRMQVRAGHQEAAIQDFTKVLQLQPQASLARAYRGQVYWQAGNLAAAQADLEAVLQERPSYLAAWEPLALINWKAGRYAVAATWLEKKYDPRLKNDNYLVLAAAAYCLSGDKAALTACVNRLQPKIEQDSPAYQALKFYLDPSQEGTSLELVKDIKNTIQKAQYQLAIAIPILKMGRKQTGINILQNVVESLPASTAEGQIAAWMLDEYKR